MGLRVEFSGTCPACGHECGWLGVGDDSTGVFLSHAEPLCNCSFASLPGTERRMGRAQWGEVGYSSSAL